MRRLFFVTIFILAAAAVLALALRLSQASLGFTPMAMTTLTPEDQAAQVAAPTHTQVACTLIDAAPVQDAQLALAVDTMYAQLPQFKTSVPIAATEDKPFSVGCLPPGG